MQDGLSIEQAPFSAILSLDNDFQIALCWHPVRRSDANRHNAGWPQRRRTPAQVSTA
jgi:hypothetical protein